MRRGQYHWLSLIGTLCLGIIIFSLRVKDSFVVQAVSNMEGESEENRRYKDYLKNIQYYYFLWGGSEKRFHLSADELLSNSKTRKIEFLKPSGEFRLRGNRSLFYRGGGGSFESLRQELYLHSDVFFSEGDSTMTSSQAVYNTKQKELKLTGNVVGLTRFGEYKSSIRIASEEALARPLLGKVRYVGEIKGDIESPRIQGQKLFFASEVLEIDLHRHHLDISKKVVFKRERFVAEGNRGEIFWSRKNKNIEHYVLHENVKLKEKVKNESGDGFFERSASAEKMEGALGDYHIILTGSPSVFQREDVLKGNRIVLKKDSDIVEVDGANANFRLREQ